MDKLFDSYAAGSQIELFRLVEQGLKNALAGKSDQFFYNIDIYINNLPSVKDDMYMRGRNEIEKLWGLNNWKLKEEHLDMLTPDYFAIFCALNNYVHVAIDMEKEGYPTSLITRNVGLLRNLNENGHIEGDIEKAIASLVGSKTEKSVKEGNYVVTRLDVVGIKDGIPKFKPMIPRSNLEIGAGRQYVIIPVPFYHMFENMVRATFIDKPFNFVKSSVIGQVSHNVAYGSNVVRKAYANSEEDAVNNKVKKLKPGYDVLNQRFFLYDLESSVHSLGVASFRPEMLDSLKPIGYSDIDTSRHNVNFSLLRGIYKTRINGATSDQLDSLGLMDLSGFANMKDKTEALIEYGESKSEKDLYWLMMSHPNVFGDVNDSLEKRERVTPKFLKNFDFIDLPVGDIQRTQLIKELLDEGVVKITATKKDGSLMERVASNKVQVLEKVLGKDYVQKYESIKNKLYHVKGLLEKGAVKNKTGLEKLGVDYNILDYLEPMDYFSDAINTGDTSDAIEAIDNAIEVLNQKSANRKIPETMILYRDINAQEPKKFFGSVDATKVISIQFSKMGK